MAEQTAFRDYPLQCAIPVIRPYFLGCIWLYYILLCHITAYYVTKVPTKRGSGELNTNVYNLTEI